MFCHLGVTRPLESLRSMVSTSLRRGQRRHLEACSTGGSARRLAALVDVARHGDPHHWWIAARHGVQHGTKTRSTSVRHSLRSWTLWLADWWTSVAQHGTLHGIRYGTTIFCTVSRTLQDCGTGHCIAPYQSCRTEGLHTNCTCILLTDANYV